MYPYCYLDYTLFNKTFISECTGSIKCMAETLDANKTGTTANKTGTTTLYVIKLPRVRTNPIKQAVQADASSGRSTYFVFCDIDTSSINAEDMDTYNYMFSWNFTDIDGNLSTCELLTIIMPSRVKRSMINSVF